MYMMILRRAFEIAAREDGQDQKVMFGEAKPSFDIPRYVLSLWRLARTLVAVIIRLCRSWTRFLRQSLSLLL